MESLITQITTVLGLDAATVGMVIAGLLDLARQGLGPDAGATLIAMVPGAPELLANNLLGSTGISLGSLLGPSPSSAQALLDLARDSGLTPDQVGSIADMLLGYVQQTAGPDAANQIYGALPGLAQLG
jgi:hypothetical protein